MLERLSHAKLNLFLEVTGKRPDGFHELETLMVRVNLADMLRFEQRDDDQIVIVPDPATPQDSFPTGPENLIHKAAVAMRQYTGRAAGVTVSVTKRIPAEAGLAGGSSNAATTLIALNDLWNCQLSKSELHGLAASLGSDLNFFVEDCRAAICRGRGEQVSPVDLNQSCFAVAVRPPMGNSTPAVFAELAGEVGTRDATELIAELQSGCLASGSERLFNRLTEPARRLNSQMDILMSEVRNCCGRIVHMSGSGSTCFVLAATAREARVLLGRLRQLNPEFLEVLQF